MKKFNYKCDLCNEDMVTTIYTHTKNLTFDKGIYPDFSNKDLHFTNIYLECKCLNDYSIVKNYSSNFAFKYIEFAFKYIEVKNNKIYFSFQKNYMGHMFLDRSGPSIFHKTPNISYRKFISLISSQSSIDNFLLLQ